MTLNTHRIEMILVSLVVVLGSAFCQATVSESCKIDLEFIPEFLLRNDAGARDHLEQLGESKLNIAIEDARAQLASIESEENCDALLKNHLINWRKDHINIRSTRPSDETPISTNQNAGLSLDPYLEFLSDKTVLIILPSFRSSYIVKTSQNS